MTSVLVSIIIVLLSICGFLLYRHWHFKRLLKLAASRIEEIRSGNVNQRIRILSSEIALNELSASMNRLVDDFQRSMETVNLLESERKKIITHLSHDLRTPLTAILGYAEALQQDATLTEETRQIYFRIILSKGNKLDALIRDFFELSKLEALAEPLELVKIDIIENVREAVLSFYRQFQSAQVEPQLQFPDYPVYVRGNGPSIDRILSNLLSNSLRYGADGGVVGVEVRETQEGVWVDIWDRGQGISDTDMPHIFERLYTGSASRNSTQQGNGFGLTIVKKLVEKQQGEIQVSSIPNEMTRFSFRLPKAM